MTRRIIALALLLLATGPAAALASPYPTLFVTNGLATAHNVVAFGAGASKDALPITTFGSSLGAAGGLARDPAGIIWVADPAKNRIASFGATAGPTTLGGGISGPDTQLSAPVGVAFDAAGHLFVVNRGSSSVTEYAAGASGDAAPIAVLAGRHTQIINPQAIAVDSDGTLLVACGSNANAGATLLMFSPGAKGDQSPTPSVALPPGNPGGVALDAAGRVFVTEVAGNDVQTMSGGYPQTLLAGPATALSHPTGVALDGAGHLWVTNAGPGNGYITEYAAGASGNAAPINTIAGTDTALHQPGALLAVSTPGVSTATDTGYSTNTATLSGTVFAAGAPTSFHFEYGSTTAYGTGTPDQLAGSRSAPQFAMANIAVKAGLTEHYRLVARNPLGTTYGADQMFTPVAGGAGPTVYVASAQYVPGGGIPISITGYAPGATGDLAPLLTIAGPHTQLIGYNPFAIAVDQSGHVFFGGLGSPVLEFAAGAHGDASPIATFGAFKYGVGGLAIDAAGHLWVSDPYGNRVVEFVQRAGSWVIASEITGTGRAGKVTVGADGRVVVHDFDNNSLRVYAPGASGNAAPIMVIGGLHDGGIATDAAGNVLVTDVERGAIRGFSPGATGPVETFGIPMTVPVDVAVDATGQVITASVPSSGHGRVAEFGSESPQAAFAILSGPATGITEAAAVAVTPGQLEITTSVLPDATVGQGYQTSLAAVGATPPYRWSATGLPPGLTINANGTLSGVPTIATGKPVAVKVTATDASTPVAGYATARLLLTVKAPVMRSVYVTDGARGTLSVFPLDVTGNIAPTFAFGQANGLLAPDGAAIDSTGRVYVVNAGSNAVTELAPGAGPGVSPDRTIAGADTGLVAPAAIALGPAGEIYVVNGPSQAVTVYAPSANGDAAPLRTISGADTGLNGPGAMTVNAAGDLWVANTAGNTLTEYAPNATGDATPIATISAPGVLRGPAGITQNAAGDLLVTNRYGAAVDRFAATANGVTTPLSVIAGPNTGLNFPHGIDIDDQGRIYVANENGPSITVYAPNAQGDAVPLATVTGTATGLASPEALVVAPPLSIQTARLPRATVGWLYRATLRGALGTEPYAWRIVHGRLPAGLHLSRGGVISGVARARGPRTVRIAVSDGSPIRLHDSRQLTLRVACPRGSFGVRCQNGPPGTRPVDVRLASGRPLAFGLPVATGRLHATLVRGRLTYARGTVVVPRRGRVRLVLHSTRRLRSGAYRLRIRSHRRTTVTAVFIEPRM
jgi:sugar lactone lactonase YvrE